MLDSETTHGTTTKYASEVKDGDLLAGIKVSEDCGMDFPVEYVVTASLIIGTSQMLSLQPGDSGGYIEPFTLALPLNAEVRVTL